MDSMTQAANTYENNVNNQSGNSEQIREKKGISGSTLKIIAILVMLIDHIGAVILERILMQNGMEQFLNGSAAESLEWMTQNAVLFGVYYVLRMIGRLGFPIFCFLLVEGFKHTRDVKKYALRLLAFALISEIPFDLATNGKFFHMGYQNVFFTLFVGLLVMLAYQYIENRQEWKKPVKVILYVVSFLAGMWLAKLLKTDYNAIGVFCIMMLYIFRKNKTHQIIAGCLSFLWEMTAPLAFIPIAFYNGKRGIAMKYAFYIFYPAHLLILYLIAVFMGIA